MAEWIRVPKFANEREKVVKVNPRSSVFTESEIIILLGDDFKIIELKSGDTMFITTQEGGVKNELASIIVGRDVFGNALLVDPEEID